MKTNMLTGYYFYTPSKEYFFVTEQTKRTEKLCRKIEDCLIKNGCIYVKDGKYRGVGVFSIHDKLEPATCEIKHTEKFGDYYDIKGEGFGGAGGFVSEGKTVILYI